MRAVEADAVEEILVGATLTRLAATIFFEDESGREVCNGALKG